MMPKGRPALSGIAKQGLLQIRVTGPERSALDAAASLAGKPTSTWARDELLRLAMEAAAKPTKKKSPGDTKKPAK